MKGLPCPGTVPSSRQAWGRPLDYLLSLGQAGRTLCLVHASLKGASSTFYVYPFLMGLWLGWCLMLSGAAISGCILYVYHFCATLGLPERQQMDENLHLEGFLMYWGRG